MSLTKINCKSVYLWKFFSSDYLSDPLSSYTWTLMRLLISILGILIFFFLFKGNWLVAVLYSLSSENSLNPICHKLLLMQSMILGKQVIFYSIVEKLTLGEKEFYSSISTSLLKIKSNKEGLKKITLLSSPFFFNQTLF